MRTELENSDIECIAQRLAEILKPLLLDSQKESDQSAYLDIQGLADYLKVSKQWIYERTRTKAIPHLKKEGLLRFRKSDIDAWLKTYTI